MKGLAEWRADPRLRHLESTLESTRVGRLVLALYRGNLRDRALNLAGQAFVALVPLLIVLATMASSSDSTAVGTWLIDRFGLEGDAADAVRQLFTRPPDATGSTSVLGFLVLLVSLSSFARSVQRSYETAWGLPPRARLRGLFGFAGAVLLAATVTSTAWVSSLAGSVTPGRFGALFVELAIGILAWWLVSWLLLSRRAPWSLLLPGAAVSATGQALTGWVGSIWIPHLVQSNTEQYGVIGVAIAILSWLVVLAFLIVASAVVGAHVGSWLAGRQPVVPAAGDA
ncbi:YihY/virulence factor BrkB family protein [Nocardioides sp. MAHUQ-72]|uniref:YihY/virulence factor BrkB family protein n=1 Tax=unclassified Nocardioides TaxID=2615069 RepID=UPI003619FF3A